MDHGAQLVVDGDELIDAGAAAVAAAGVGAAASMCKLYASEMVGRVADRVVQIFGGAKFLVPANWVVKSEAVAILGGVDDKRNVAQPEPGKQLVLKGFVMFGGIEIKSY